MRGAGGQGKHGHGSPFVGVRRTRRRGSRLLLALALVAVALTASVLLISAPSAQRALAVVATNGGCPTPAARARSERTLLAATARYRLESGGVVSHVDLRRIAHDPVLVAALSSGNLPAARAEANRQLIHHVVRIRVLRGARVLVDANAPSFDVAGPSMELHGAGGAHLGRLEITLQDVIGYVKLLHKLDAADVVVHGSGGHVHTSLPAAAAMALPRSGCVNVGAHRYVVVTLNEAGFAGEQLSIALLTAA